MRILVHSPLLLSVKLLLHSNYRFRSSPRIGLCYTYVCPVPHLSYQSDCSSVTNAGVPAEEDIENYLTWQ